MPQDKNAHQVYWGVELVKQEHPSNGSTAYLTGRDGVVYLTEKVFDLKKEKWIYVMQLSSVIRLAYQVHQFNRNLARDYSDLFTWLSPLPRPLICPIEMRQITEN